MVVVTLYLCCLQNIKYTTRLYVEWIACIAFCIKIAYNNFSVLVNAELFQNRWRKVGPGGAFNEAAHVWLPWYHHIYYLFCTNFRLFVQGILHYIYIHTYICTWERINGTIEYFMTVFYLLWLFSPVIFFKLNKNLNYMT